MDVHARGSDDENDGSREPIHENEKRTVSEAEQDCWWRSPIIAASWNGMDGASRSSRCSAAGRQHRVLDVLN